MPNILAALVALVVIGVFFFAMSIIGTIAALIVACFLVAVAFAFFPRWLARFLAKAFTIELVLPALGLLGFLGGFFSAMIAVVLVGIASMLTFAVLGRTGLMSDANRAIAESRIHDPMKAQLIRFVIFSAVFAVALWLASLVDSNIVLFGLKETIFSGAILGLVHELVRR